MKLAVSNIAWPAGELKAHLRLLSELGCDGVELAPSLIWPEPTESSAAERRALRRLVEDGGLEVAGLHSLLYTRPELQLLAGEGPRDELVDYLRALVRLCADLGGQTLVFGSPRSRQRSGLPYETALDRAAAVFRLVADVAADHGAYLCIEPLGPDESDFIGCAREGMDLVCAVDHPNFCLHLDAKAMLAAGDDPAKTISTFRAHLKHFHVGDPGLRPPGSTGVDHRPFGRALRAASYDRFVSIEMRPTADSSYDVIPAAVRYVREQYFRQSA